MLTFLRKIRRSLIESNSARKYLLYATGEVLLVMIGILLALQVNNWNQGRMTDKIEINVLKKLIGDLESDRIQFMRRDTLYQIHLEELIDTKKLFAKDEHSNEDILKMTQLYGVRLLEINPQRTAYDEMLNSGNIYNISNDALVEEIVDYYQEIEDRQSLILSNTNDLTALMNGIHMTDYWNLMLYDKLNLQEIRSLFILSGKKTPTFKVLKRVSGWGVGAVYTQKRINSELIDENRVLSEKVNGYLGDK